MCFKATSVNRKLRHKFIFNYAVYLRTTLSFVGGLSKTLRNPKIWSVSLRSNGPLCMTLSRKSLLPLYLCKCFVRLKHFQALTQDPVEFDVNGSSREGPSWKPSEVFCHCCYLTDRSGGGGGDVIIERNRFCNRKLGKLGTHSGVFAKQKINTENR